MERLPFGRQVGLLRADHYLHVRLDRVTAGGHLEPQREESDAAHSTGRRGGDGCHVRRTLRGGSSGACGRATTREKGQGDSQPRLGYPPRLEPNGGDEDEEEEAKEQEGKVKQLGPEGEGACALG